MRWKQFRLLSFGVLWLCFFCSAVVIQDKILATVVMNLGFIAFGGVVYMTYFHAKVVRADSSLIERLVLACMLILPFWFFVQQFSGCLLRYIADVNFEQYQHAVASNYLLFILLTLIVAPITEELLMRGLLFNMLRRYVPLWIAYLLSASIFALLHGTLLHLYPGVVLGLLFTFVYVYTGQLRYSILCHLLYNGFSLLFSGLRLPNFVFMPVAVVLSQVFVIIIFCWIYRRVYPKADKTIANIRL